MSEGDRARPGSYSWIATVYAKNDHGNDQLAGCGVVIDDRRILTCAHVVGRFEEGGWAGETEVRVAFPKGDEGGSGVLLPVRGVVFPDSGTRENDLAVLHLSTPLPAGVKAAPLRSPESASLASGRWRVLGFPDDPVGESASGTVEELARGWIRLNKESGDRLRLGFSGSGVWSAEYQAVVAVVAQAGGGDGRAITLRQADALLPQESLGDLARWSLAHDREAQGHWEPRAHGVSIGSHRRPRFRGRKSALLAITHWLDQDRASRRVLAVTGAPGAGKSAVLARIVTTADPGRAGELPASDDGIRAAAMSVGCAVHAKGKTALEVATEIARAASAKLPDRLEGLDHILRRALEQRRIPDDGSSLRPRRFNVVIDALDEAVSPEQARKVIREVILPVAGTCADAGAQVIIGLRRTDAEGDLLEAFGSSAELVDLDSEEFFAREDLAAYALATLQMADREQDGSPYADDMIARSVADRIAELSDRNFLVAGLTAQTHGMFDTTPVDPAAMSFIPEVTSVMREYLRRIPEVAGMPRPAEVLTALAFAEVPGFPASLWRLAIQTLMGDDVPELRLARFARSQAGSFLVESLEEGGQDSAFRLFHQALNDALLSAVDPGMVTRAEQALTHAFLRAGRNVGWEHAPSYLLRSLPAHAARVRLVDDLLADDEYLLHADVHHVLRVAGQTVSPAARERVRLLGLTPWAADAGSAERAAMFSVTEALAGLSVGYREDPRPVPYHVRWSAAAPRHEALTLNNPDGTAWAVCAVRAGNRTLLATGSSDRTVRLWDPADGTQVHVLTGHADTVSAVCAVEAGDRTLLATGNRNGRVRLWDPASGSVVCGLGGHDDAVVTMCAVRAGNRTLLATGSNDKTIRLWDPAEVSLVRVLKGYSGAVVAVCAVDAGDRTLLATVGSNDKTVRLRDVADGSSVRFLKGHAGAVTAVCAVGTGDRTLLATVSRDGTVRLWDPADGTQVHVLEGYTGTGAVDAVCAVDAGDRTLLATLGSRDGTVRLRNPADGSSVRFAEGYVGAVDAVCAVDAGSRTLLATGSRDGTVRLWDPADGTQVHVLEGYASEVTSVCAVDAGDRTLLAATGSTHGTVRPWEPADWEVRLWEPADGTLVRVLKSHVGRVTAMCAVHAGDRVLLATGRGDGTVQLWDPTSGSLVRFLKGGTGVVTSVCAVEAGDRTLLAASSGGTVRLWDPADGSLVHVLEGYFSWALAMGVHTRGVTAMCAVDAGDRALLATGSRDGTVRLWDPADGTQVHVLEGYASEVTSVCAVDAGDRTLLATSSGRTVRLWDPADGSCVLSVPVHGNVPAMTSVAGSLAIGLTTGVLVIRIDAEIPA